MSTKIYEDGWAAELELASLPNDSVQTYATGTIFGVPAADSKA